MINASNSYSIILANRMRQKIKSIKFNRLVIIILFMNRINSQSKSKMVKPKLSQYCVEILE